MQLTFSQMQIPRTRKISLNNSMGLTDLGNSLDGFGIFRKGFSD